MANANDNSALMNRLDVKKPTTTSGMKVVLGKMMSEIATALPVHLKNNAARYARQLITLHSSNPYLQRCSLGSQLGALMTAAALGLELSPQLGQCYIVPYKSEAQFQLGYKGAIDLAMRSGRIARIYADVVYEKDKFKYSKGLHGELIHEDADEEDRGKVRYVYALAEFTNGGYAFDVWTAARVEAHAKKFSQAYKAGRSTPWITDWDAMAKKTLILAIWKYLPISTDLQQAYAAEGTVKTISAQTDIDDEKGVLDLMNAVDAEVEDVEALTPVSPVEKKQAPKAEPSMAERLAQMKEEAAAKGTAEARSYRVSQETDQSKPTAPMSDENGAV